MFSNVWVGILLYVVIGFVACMISFIARMYMSKRLKMKYDISQDRFEERLWLWKVHSYKLYYITTAIAFIVWPVLLTVMQVKTIWTYRKLIKEKVEWENYNKRLEEVLRKKYEELAC